MLGAEAVSVMHPLIRMLQCKKRERDAYFTPLTAAGAFNALLTRKRFIATKYVKKYLAEVSFFTNTLETRCNESLESDIFHFIKSSIIKAKIIRIKIRELSGHLLNRSNTGTSVKRVGKRCTE